MTLNDETILGLLANAAAVAGFEPLGAAKARRDVAASTGCGCGGKVAAATDFDAVRRGLAGMPADRKDAFKALVGGGPADTVAGSYLAPDGSRVSFSF